jgi:guanylate kinase
MPPARRAHARPPDTTRAPRPGEEDGREYHFVSADEFARLQADGAFLETAAFSGNRYGTSFAAVRALGAGGRRAILDIEAQGVRQVKASDLDPVYVFLAPPAVGALKQRLQGRGTDAREGAHDVVIVNDSVERAYALLREVALGVRIVGDALPPLDDE